MAIFISMFLIRVITSRYFFKSRLKVAILGITPAGLAIEQALFKEYTHDGIDITFFEDRAVQRDSRLFSIEKKGNSRDLLALAKAGEIDEVYIALNGKQIPVWKFRTMRVMENSAVVTQATRNDPRITRFGAFLRKTSLDELPQFFNVLQGTMSIVGPRPHAVAHNEQYRVLVENYMIRHKVKPGITGLAQIHGFRGETDTIDKMEKRIQYDLEYIQSWSLLLDIKIVFLTFFRGFVGKNAF